MPLVARLLVAWAVNVAALYVAELLFGGVQIDGWRPLLLAAAVLGILSALLRPVLVVLSIPLIVLTLGLFLLVINVVVLALTSRLVPGFDITGFWTYVGTVVVTWLVNAVVDRVGVRG